MLQGVQTRLGALTLAAATCAAACSDSGGGGTPVDSSPGGQCQVERLMPPDEGNAHIGICLPVSYNSKPPSSGTHYGTWPVFRAYDQPVPWGFLVHGLEHGAVVIAYNCPQGCADEVQAAKEVIAAAPARPGCPRAPVILTPDPTLDVRWGAAAWGHVLRAPCLDRQAFGDFIAERRDKGLENIPNDCGASDREAMGWCP